MLRWTAIPWGQLFEEGKHDPCSIWQATIWLHSLFDPGMLPSSANWCILGNVYLRSSDALNKPVWRELTCVARTWCLLAKCTFQELLLLLPSLWRKQRSETQAGQSTALNPQKRCVKSTLRLLDKGLLSDKFCKAVTGLQQLMIRKQCVLIWADYLCCPWALTWLALMHMKHTRFTHWSKPCMQAASMCKQEMHKQMPIDMKPTWPQYTQCIVNVDNIVNVDHIANVHNIVSVYNIMNIDRVMNIEKVWADLSSSTAPGQQKQSPAKTGCWTPSPHGTPGPQRCAASPKKCRGHPRFSDWGVKSARQATEAGGGKLQNQFGKLAIQKNTGKLH